jgi:hypothetical protein
LEPGIEGFHEIFDRLRLPICGIRGDRFFDVLSNHLRGRLGIERRFTKLGVDFRLAESGVA